jgi:carbamoyltransferase
MPDLDFGIAYGQIGYPISEIIPGPDNNRYSLSYAGKVMGLCAYGHVRDEWLPAMEYYYEDCNLDILGTAIGLELGFNSFQGQAGYDLAATSQYVFEQKLLELIEPYLNDNENFIIVGGCGLNVLFNQRFKKLATSLDKEFYVPSNPNDCGLALGQYLTKYPNSKFDVYNGFELLDAVELETYVKSRNAIKITISGIVDLIKQGKIIGHVQGNSEIGPRALGNRSIICDPSIADMKDILNAKVKFREWFRPFAPVCRLEDKDIFFDQAYESEFMSYAPLVKNKYKSKLKSICHHDGSARLQTVSNSQHKTFYKILSELNDRNEIPVILNTSFNIKGQPILTTIKDALYCLDNTHMDYVIIEGWLFKRKLNE